LEGKKNKARQSKAMKNNTYQITCNVAKFSIAGILKPFEQDCNQKCKTWNYNWPL
jgi:hypothetical protein